MTPTELQDANMEWLRRMRPIGPRASGVERHRQIRSARRKAKRMLGTSSDSSKRMPKHAGSAEDAARGGEQAKRLAWKSKAADRSCAGAPDQQEVAFVSGIGETGGRKGLSSGGLEAVSPCIRGQRRRRTRILCKAASGALSSLPHIHDPRLGVARQAREALRCSCSGQASK